jgi:magnesium-transporting ATPase (P-type)
MNCYQMKVQEALEKLTTNELRVDEAMLTGESLPRKNAPNLSPKKTWWPRTRPTWLSWTPLW